MALDYAAIGQRIRMFRIKRGWKQSDLAEKSGVEPSNISHIERAATKLSLPTLVSIANALEVSLDEIVYNSLIKNKHIYVKEIDELVRLYARDIKHKKGASNTYWNINFKGRL